MAFFDFGRKTLNAGQSRPPFESFYIYALLALIAYFAADLTVIYLRPQMLPTKPPPQRPSTESRLASKDLSQYSSITRKNIFNADGKIPPPITGEGPGGEGDMDGDPVLTQLPIKLEGTLVHANPRKSIATIVIQSKNSSKSYMVDDDMEGMGRIVRVERRKVIFRNSSNQRLEYVEIPKETAVAFGARNPAPQSAGPIKQSGEFNFTVSRQEVEKHLSNLGAVLNQARMVPNIVPGTGGRVQGFRFVSIQPDSIFSKLGFKPMDVITSVQGEPVNSPTKAMELYNALRTEDNIKITINRNGRDETIEYNVVK